MENRPTKTIPQGWKSKTVDQVFDFYPTATYSRDKQVSQNSDTSIKYIHYGDIHTKYNILLDASNPLIPHIDGELKKDFELVKDGDLIIADTSEDYDGVGKCVEVVNVGDNQIISGLHTLMLRQKGDDFIDGFKGYFFSGEQVRNSLLRIVTGIKVYSITKTTLAKVNLLIPCHQDQEAFVSILSKVDEAIVSVQNSIAAAERLKKSLMQNLLTGKMKPDGTIRTPGEFYIDEKFGKVPVGWEVKRVKDFGEVITGKTPPTDEPEVFSDKERGYMFITPGDLDSAKHIEKTERYVSDKGIKYSYVLPKNSVCEVCIGSTIGKIGITTEECCTNQQLTSVIVNKENDAEYFYYAMSFRREHFKSVAGINATPQINKSGYSKYRILCPKDKKEQVSIALKICSIDDNIVVQEQKVRVLERLKKSLMQNLMTGKVRIKTLITK